MLLYTKITQMIVITCSFNIESAVLILCSLYLKLYCIDNGLRFIWSVCWYKINLNKRKSFYYLYIKQILES